MSTQLARSAPVARSKPMTVSRRSFFSRFVGGEAFFEQDKPKADAAHILRRLTMTVHQERVDELSELSRDDAIRAALESGWENIPAAAEDQLDQIPNEEDDWSEVSHWWVNQMTDPTNGITDRLTWFWHSLLTTNAYKVDGPELVATQLTLLRANSRGNFHDLLHKFVGSGALLQYLDASYSVASQPNENLGRELMELYTVGRGNYSQDDVRAAARALAGWVVEDGKIEFRPENAFIAPLVFMEEQKDWDTTSIVDRLCEHPATAARISGRMWRFLIGSDLPPDSAAELGRWWKGQDLEIEPLVERIVTDPSFFDSRMTRPRSAIEWFCATSVLNRPDDPIWALDGLGQAPFLPPTPAGWPDGDRWLATGSIGRRARYAHSLDLSNVASEHESSSPAEAVADVIQRCALHSLSPGTLKALESIVHDDEYLPINSAALARWRIALTCPEAHLS